MVTAAPTSLSLLLFDDFDIAGADVNRTIWNTPTGNDGFFGRTAIRNPASQPNDSGKVQVADGVAHLLLSPFNPKFHECT